MYFRLLHVFAKKTKSVCVVVYIFLFGISVQAQIKWDGEAGDGLWNSAANWVGDIVPVNGDNVLLDNSFVSGSYMVALPTGNITISLTTLQITPSAGYITLLLPPGNVANPGLEITGAGDAMILNNGAIFQNSSGAVSGTTFSIVNTFRINNGGRYIHNTDRPNNSIVSQLSTAAGTESGIFEYKVPVTPAITASGRVYGTLILSTNAGTKTYTVPSAGSPLTVRGDFIINNNVNLTWSASANLIIEGKLQQASMSTFNLSSASHSPLLRVKGDVDLKGTLTETGTGTPVLEFNGVTNQNVSVTGSITNSIDFKVNNSAGITLQSPVTLTGTLHLSNGNIKTSAVNMMTLTAGASLTGGSATSFVEGPITKIGNTDFTFPVGAGSVYAPITIATVAGEAVTDVFIAEYHRRNPQSVIGASVMNGLDHVSYVEYWNLQQTTGAAIKRISLQVNPESFSKALASTYVSRFDGSQWTNEGNTIINGPFISGNYQAGVIQSVNNISDFGDFTLATNLVYAMNPLPLNLISFEAKKSDQGEVILNWQLAERNHIGVQFIVQRAINNNQYADIAFVAGGMTGIYYYSDKTAAGGYIYYRLKMIDTNGDVTFSKTVIVKNKIDGLMLSLSAAILSSSSLIVEMQSDKEQRILCMIVDMQGRALCQWNLPVSKGINRLDFSAYKLLPGIYHLVTISPGGEKVIRKFIRQ